MFKFIDFQFFYCNIFIFYVHHLEKIFADMSYMHQRRCYDKGQDIWKSSLFSKKAMLTII